MSGIILNFPGPTLLDLLQRDPQLLIVMWTKHWNLLLLLPSLPLGLQMVTLTLAWTLRWRGWERRTWVMVGGWLLWRMSLSEAINHMDIILYKNRKLDKYIGTTSSSFIKLYKFNFLIRIDNFDFHWNLNDNIEVLKYLPSISFWSIAKYSSKSSF